MKRSKLSISCSISDNDYRLVVIQNHRELLYREKNSFNNNTSTEMAQILGERIDALNLIAEPCQLVLQPDQYQLILMDALQMPTEDMIKAFRWRLKGLTNYDLKDIAIDIFFLPVNPNTAIQKVCVAITPLSILQQQRLLLQSAYLDPISITIADMTLKNCLPLLVQKPKVDPNDGPFIIISNANNGKTLDKLHLSYQGLLYLIRELASPSQEEEPIDISNILAEIQRSVDYCVNTLQLPEPKYIIFTPWELLSKELVREIKKNLQLPVINLDINRYLTIPSPLSVKDQHDVFYNIMGALQ